jgi:hypothetical protein
VAVSPFSWIYTFVGKDERGKKRKKKREEKREE